MKKISLFAAALFSGLLATSFSMDTLAKNDKGKGGKDLPPGLEKNHSEGKALPPGWQKKLAPGETMDASVYAHAKKIKPEDYEFSPDGEGMVTVKIEGKVVRLMESSLEIIDILQ